MPKFHLFTSFLFLFHRSVTGCLPLIYISLIQTTYVEDSSENLPEASETSHLLGLILLHLYIFFPSPMNFQLKCRKAEVIFSFPHLVFSLPLDLCPKAPFLETLKRNNRILLYIWRMVFLEVQVSSVCKLIDFSIQLIKILNTFIIQHLEN